MKNPIEISRKKGKSSIASFICYFFLFFLSIFVLFTLTFFLIWLQYSPLPFQSTNNHISIDNNSIHRTQKLQLGKLHYVNFSFPLNSLCRAVEFHESNRFPIQKLFYTLDFLLYMVLFHSFHLFQSHCGFTLCLNFFVDFWIFFLTFHFLDDDHAQNVKQKFHS